MHPYMHPNKGFQKGEVPRRCGDHCPNNNLNFSLSLSLANERPHLCFKLLLLLLLLYEDEYIGSPPFHLGLRGACLGL